MSNTDIKKRFLCYFNDMLTGAVTREEAVSICDKLIEFTCRGGINLRK